MGAHEIRQAKGLLGAVFDRFREVVMKEETGKQGKERESASIRREIKQREREAERKKKKRKEKQREQEHEKCVGYIGKMFWGRGIPTPRLEVRCGMPATPYNMKGQGDAEGTWRPGLLPLKRYRGRLAWV